MWPDGVDGVVVSSSEKWQQMGPSQECRQGHRLQRTCAGREGVWQLCPGAPPDRATGAGGSHSVKVSGRCAAPGGQDKQAWLRMDWDHHGRAGWAGRPCCSWGLCEVGTGGRCFKTLFWGQIIFLFSFQVCGSRGSSRTSRQDGQEMMALRPTWPLAEALERLAQRTPAVRAEESQ